MPGKVETVVLGLLADGPRHAYDLVREYHKRAMDNWVDVGDASIYQALPRLKRSGLIELASEKSNKRVYRLTNAGRQHLRQALLSQLSSKRPYELELNVAIGFVDKIKREEAVRALAERHRFVLDIVRSMGEIPYDRKEGERSLPHDMIAMQRFRMAEAELAWLDRIIQWLGGPIE
ncbi:MAG: PadR family transcriptional regulator [Actinobacteria bacterium]|nr:PadR family transcriptional regulator [Actinomycetota bacterium]